MAKEEEEKFSAKEFVENLLNAGTECPCDDTLESFHSSGVPKFYDEDLFKRGQKFFNDNIFALFYSKFLGLLSVLAVPNVVKMLTFTNQSNSPLAAYRRYLSTIFHMCIWYQSDFTPESKLWQSLLQVKSRHNSASKKCSMAGLGRITQKDMALTQFGFMGFAVFKREEVGICNVKDEDLHAFIHLWRVVGATMGIKDKYNICRESLEETRQICKILAEEVLRPVIVKKEQDFLKLAKFLADGMWSMNPTLNSDVYLNIVYRCITPHSEMGENQKWFIEMNYFRRLLYYFLFVVIWSLRFTVMKTFCNYLQYMTLWLMKYCPFLGYYQFGYHSSHVRVLN